MQEGFKGKATCSCFHTIKYELLVVIADYVASLDCVKGFCYVSLLFICCLYICMIYSWRKTDLLMTASLLCHFCTVCVCLGSQGVFCEVQPTDRQRLEFLTKLGFLEILRGEARSREGVVLGRLL